MPADLLHDEHGQLRVQLYPLAFQDLADAAFDPIRQDARKHVAVAIRLLEGLTMLAGCAPGAAERDVLRRHGHLITVDALHETGNEKDRGDIEGRALALQEALEGRPAASD
jgi:uncharacterized membrane protein